MRLNTLLLMLVLLLTAAYGNAQITVHAKNAPIEQVMKSIESQTDYVFFYKNSLKDIKITVDAVNAPIKNVLNACFKNLPLTYKIVNKTIAITEKKQTNNVAPQATKEEAAPKWWVTGTVTDTTGKPLPGVTIRLDQGKVGAISNAQGQYKIIVSESNKTLTFSYIGMEAKVVEINNLHEMNVQLKYIVEQTKDIVVTGFFKKRKSSFTGAVNTFTGDELKAVAPNNVFEALALLTPGLVKMENNKAGSNPNALPDLLVRGVTSFANNDQTVNQPLIVRDGTIISIRDLYDMNINEIESVTILKDAAAAALYGAKAANGVIVIERKRLTGGKMKVIYNQTSSIEFPDFSDYNVLNPMQKLEYEKLAGLYNSTDPASQQSLDSVYNVRLMNINRGVNTDWLAKPSRVGFSTDHSVRLTGGAGKTRYELNLRYGSVKGVMKDDERNRYGLGFTLQYHATNGLTFTNRTNLNQVAIRYSPYGSFSNYTKMNPYDRVYNSFGEFNKILSWDINNPLYEASLGSFSKAKNQVLTNDFDLRWVLSSKFTATSHFNFTLNGDKTEQYTSPLSGLYKDETDLSQKGALSITNGNGLTYSGNVVLTYNEAFKEGSLLTTNIGANFNHINVKSYAFTGVGFYSDALQSINFATSYPLGGAPGGAQDLNADVAGFLNANYSYKNRYYVDGVYQISGSSKFGANNRYSQFWSAGIGWNMHNETFLKNDWLNILKLRFSTGYTGKTSFSSYQALTTYRYNIGLDYLTGIGAVPITIGNPDLTWERTMNYNAGIDISVLDRRVNLTADVYIRRTNDLLIDKTLPPSTGVISAKANLGQIENRGYEIKLDAYVIKNNNLQWLLGGNVSHNENKILKISNALKAQNDANNALPNVIEPLPQFQEGHSTTALYVVRSAGIDPATGKEVYIKRNGERTFVYDPADKVEVGDLQPKLIGTFYSMWSYKGFSLAAYFRFNCGQTIYNSTLATKVEGSNPKFNADERVFNDRWKQPGDIALYRDIADQSAPYQTSRFVEKDNTLMLSRLNLNYEIGEKFLGKIGVQKASVGVSMNDLLRLSTVEIERGTDYLYSRGVNFTLNVIF